MAGKIDEWREAGFSEEQIQEYIGRKSAEWRGAGFGEEEINGYLGRSDFDRSCAEIHIDQPVCDYRNFPVLNGENNCFADHIFVSFVFRIDSYCRVSQHCFWSGSSNNNEAFAF